MKSDTRIPKLSVENLPRKPVLARGPHGDHDQPLKLHSRPQPILPAASPPAWARRQSHGLTLTEVLISMLLLTLGLLGVAAMFPVGSHYLRTGEVADRGAAIAEAALADLSARGILQPNVWLTYGAANAFDVPLQVAYESALGALNTGVVPLPEDEGVQQQFFNHRLGGIFVIDPLGAESMPLSPLGSVDARREVGTQFVPFGRYTDSYQYDAPQWDAWVSNPTPGLGAVQAWPIRRVSLPAAHALYRGPVAETLFRSHDDLALETTDANDEPTVGRWEVADLDNDGDPSEPLSRQANGDYSWLVTIVPQTAAARLAVVSDPTAHAYDVSVVVFYKRVIEDLFRSERLVEGAVISKGLSGGELLLSKLDVPALSDQNPFTDMRRGEWLLISGPHPSSTTDHPHLFAAWYKVLSIDDDSVTNRATERLVSLRGPEWPWKAENPASDAAVANDLRVGIFPGAVAVHNRKMHLEGNSLWSAR